LTINTFTRVGYTFSGWNTLASGTGTAYADGATYPFTAPATLYAQWTAVFYAVTFNANGGTGAMANETDNAPTALTANAFTWTGYTFTGWNTLANGTGTAYAGGATYPFTAATTLYAQWSLNQTFTVTFNANGGTGAMANESDNSPTALTTNAFTLTGFNFGGWNTAANGSGTAYANGGTYPFTSSVTLYAQWDTPPPAGGGGPPPAAQPYTVTFNANGGTGAMANETESAPTALSSNSFARTGYTFTGWNTAASGSGTAYANGATYPFTASATLYAQWKLAGPGAPSDLSATNHDGDVTLSWSAPVPAGTAVVLGYNVYEGTASGGESQNPSNGANLVTSTTFVLDGLAPGTYFFTVEAQYSSGPSLPSNEASLTLQRATTPTSTSLILSKRSVATSAERTVVFLVRVTAHGSHRSIGGLVKIKVDGRALCQTSVSANGSGSCRVPSKALAVGTYSVVASFGGATGLGVSMSNAERLKIT
jgi:uncharacterized repeat protein (TIGR02543 family)